MHQLLVVQGDIAELLQVEYGGWMYSMHTFILREDGREENPQKPLILEEKLP